jgi:hypothetical protein
MYVVMRRVRSALYVNVGTAFIKIGRNRSYEEMHICMLCTSITYMLPKLQLID